MHNYKLIEWQLKLLFPDDVFHFKHKRDRFYVITHYYNDNLDEHLLKFAMSKLNYRFIRSWDYLTLPNSLYSLSRKTWDFIMEPVIFLFKKMKEFIPLTEFIGMI